jgi:hypothetical protein
MSEALRDKSDQALLDNAAPPKKLTPEQKPGWVKKLDLVNLPRLPIPDLKLTMQRYIETISPLVSDEELNETKVWFVFVLYLFCTSSHI